MIDREFFAGKIPHWLNFRVVLFLLLWPLDEINLLYLFVEGNISFVIFLLLEVINEKFFTTKISQSTVF